LDKVAHFVRIFGDLDRSVDLSEPTMSSSRQRFFFHSIMPPSLNIVRGYDTCDIWMTLTIPSANYSNSPVFALNGASIICDIPVTGIVRRRPLMLLGTTALPMPPVHWLWSVVPQKGDLIADALARQVCRKHTSAPALY
jgi:hypothetical protein